MHSSSSSIRGTEKEQREKYGKKDTWCGGKND